MSRFLTRCGLLVAVLLPAAAQADTTFKIATLAPEGTTWMKEMRAGADEVERRTAGRVKFKFYPGGIMGNDASVLRKMRIGQLQGAAVTGNSLSDIYPDAQLYSLPLLFRSYAEVDYVRGKMDPILRKGLEDAGLVPIGFTEGGFAYLFSQRQVASQDDLKKCKIWLPENDIINTAAFESAGVTPVPLPFADVYTGLQTGLLDTVVTLPTAAIAFQWHTKLKTFTDHPLSYLIGVLAINKKAFDGLSAEDQATVRSVMAASFERLNKLNREDNENARAALRKQGLEFNTLSAAEREKWQAFADEAIVKLKGAGVYTPALLEQLRGHLVYFRAQAAATPR
ncbi:MAG TPA: TRAP transporter substrate-binding protein DctP [Nevskiales bacterium]|nr:TRAP transporter substrate-binding protein DctP [Nevskiales bacterium]